MASPSPSATTLIGESSRPWSPFIEDGKSEDRKVPRRYTSLSSLITAAPRQGAGFLKAAPGQAWRDLRSASWGKCFLWALLIFWLALLGIALGYLAEVGADDGELGSNFACQADGKFSVYAYRFNWWASDTFFQISLARGSFSFTEVKVLDIAVQLIVGRGGQALMAFISWRAFRNYLTAKMTQSPVTFATFFVIFLQAEPTVVSTYRLAREFCLHRRPGSIAAGIFIPVSVIFLFIFPTFVNTTTGYVADADAYVEGYDNKMILFGEFDKIAYVIHDGDRIGEEEDFIVPVYAHDALIYDFEYSYSDCYGDGDERPKGCHKLDAATKYVEKYGFFGLLDDETTWDGDIELDAPALNISGFYSPPDDPVYAYDWEDPRKKDGDMDERYPFRNSEKTRFTTSSVAMYDMDHIKEHGRCQPSSDSYKWGVSFIQLFLMTLALLVWSLGTAIMWFSGHRRLPLVGEPGIVHGWRAVVKLAHTMEAELPAAGVDIDTMTDDAVKREVRKRLRGGTVSFKGHVLSRGDGDLRAVTLAWLRKEVWWAIAFAACLGVTFLCYFGMRYKNGGLWEMLGIMFSSFTGLLVACVGLGTTHGSRLFMLSVGVVVILAVVLPLFGPWF